MDREPRDFELARRAYEAYYDEQPQIWFEDLSHQAQMRWVRAARAVLTDAKKYKRRAYGARIPKPVPEGSYEAELDKVSAELILASAPRRANGKIDWKALTNEGARRRVRNAYKIVWRLKKKGT